MEISWLDFSDKDRKKVMDIIALIHEGGAVDELGIGVIRDYFAEKFFPGTSTIQTKAKYFLLNTYIFKDLEKEKIKDMNKFMNRLDFKEERCARALLEIANKNGTEKEGIIGWRNLEGRKHRWVKRRPTEIYWGGLRTYGIFNQKKYSLSQYVKYITSNQDDEKREFWNCPPTYKKEWMEELEKNGGIELNKEEAEFLKEQIISKQGNTLLGIILKKYWKEFSKLNEDRFIFDNLYDIIIKKDVPNEIRDEYIFAKDISDFLYCAQIRYNVILANENFNCNVDQEYKKRLIHQWQDYRKNLKKIAEKAEIEKIFKNIKDRKLNEFLKNLRKEMLSNKNIEEKEKNIDELVIKREKQKKDKERAKLNKPSTENINSWHGINKLIYRTDRAHRLILDIMKGLREDVRY